MISRVRHLKSKIIKTYKGDIPDYEFSDFWNFEEVKAGMIESRDCILKPMYVKENGQIERLLKLEPYNVNAIYNKIEDLNKNQYYFMSYLKHLGAKKGYKIYNHSDPFLEEEDTEEKDTKSKMKFVLEAPVHVVAGTLDIEKFMVFDVSEGFVTQAAFEVNWQVMASDAAIPEPVYVLEFAPKIFTPFFFH
jgi:hypothetical protein